VFIYGLNIREKNEQKKKFILVKEVLT